MWTIILTKIFTLLMPLVLAFNSIGFTVTGLDGVAEIDYQFANSIQGSAAGKITVTSKIDGDYEIYWGDENYKMLYQSISDYDVYYSELASIDVEKGKGSTDIQSFTAIPEGAETLLVFKNHLLYGKEEIPDNKVTDNGDIQYRFGALSDIHFNRYDRSHDDDSCFTFPNALNFLDKCGVSFVGISGDISNGAEKDAYEKFNKYTSQHDFPVYSCTGNHDLFGGSKLKNWKALMNQDAYGEVKGEGIVNVADNNLDFVYAPKAAKGDVFIFLCQTSGSYLPGVRLLSEQQLKWLKAQLETYKDTTVYLYFHTFIANDNGNVSTGEGNLKNKAGATYLLYYRHNADEKVLREYLKEYKNVVFFNGHSHWSYDMQKYNPNLNITDYNGKYATLVHISSCGSPRSISSNSDLISTENYLENSEGYLVTVYKDRIVLNGVNFLRGQFLSYATYNIEK